MNLPAATSRRRTTARSPRDRRAADGGFTLVEMLVVVSLMILLMGLGVPTIVGMVRSGRIESGVNAVSAAVTMSQARLPSPKATAIDLAAMAPGGGPNEQSPSDVSLLPMRPVTRSTDTAILFTPSGEIRFLEVDETAVSGSGDFLSRTVAPGSTNRYRVAFKDRTDVESIRIPSGIGIVGITRGNNGINGLLLLPPPFAIRFNPLGRLIQGRPGATSTTQDRLVFYNGDYNLRNVTIQNQPAVKLSQIEVGADRASSSELPDAYDRNGPLYDAKKAWPNDADAKAANKAVVPLEAIDTVVGVILYDKNKFYGNFTDGWPAYSSQASGAEYIKCCEWVLANGKPVFFSRYSGSLLKD